MSIFNRDPIEVRVSNLESQNKKLITILNSKLDLSKKDMDSKIVGMYRQVSNMLLHRDEDIAITANLMKQVAQLEGIKEKVESRRSTEEIIATVDRLKKDMLTKDAKGQPIEGETIQVKTLAWVLGDE